MPKLEVLLIPGGTATKRGEVDQECCGLVYRWITGISVYQGYSDLYTSISLQNDNLLIVHLQDAIQSSIINFLSHLYFVELFWLRKPLIRNKVNPGRCDRLTCVELWLLTERQQQPCRGLRQSHSSIYFLHIQKVYLSHHKDSHICSIYE